MMNLTARSATCVSLTRTLDSSRTCYTDCTTLLWESIHVFVKEQRAKYRSDTVSIPDRYDFPQYETLRTIDLYHNSAFLAPTRTASMFVMQDRSSSSTIPLAKRRPYAATGKPKLQCNERSQSMAALGQSRKIAVL